MKYTNEELVAKFQSGEDVFEKIVEQNYGLISSTAYDYSRKSNISYDDLFSEFLFTTWNVSKKFKGELGNKFTTLLTSSMKNTYIKMVISKDYRKNKGVVSLNKNVSMYDGAEVELLHTLTSPHSTYTFEEVLKETVIDILKKNRVKPDKIDRFVRVVLKDESREEVAKQYGISTQTLNARIAELRKILAKELPKRGFNI